MLNVGLAVALASFFWLGRHVCPKVKTGSLLKRLGFGFHRVYAKSHEKAHEQ